MTLPGQPEMRPDAPGERVHLADLQVGDVVDWWTRRSGTFILRENIRVIRIHDGEVTLSSGHVLRGDAGWGEVRLKERA